MNAAMWLVWHKGQGATHKLAAVQNNVLSIYMSVTEKDEAGDITFKKTGSVRDPGTLTGK